MRRTSRLVLPVAAAVATVALVAATDIASLDAGRRVASSGAAGPVALAAAEQDVPAGAEDGASAGAGGGASAAAEQGAPVVAGSAAAEPVEPLAAACEESELPLHTGFQVGPACVATSFGEVAAAEDNPQLLITDAPAEVGVGQAFTIEVSTRNLVRDRFLPAADGGYYVEPSTLNEDGLVRGHFHTACRVLGNTAAAPQPARQAVFVATEDNGGGAAPDTVTVQIPGLPAAGEAQCATWAGDGSHRMPMMQFANQIPAFDAVRITVTSGAQERTAADAGEPADAGGRGADTQPSGSTPTPGATPSPGSGGGTDISQRTESGGRTGAGEDGTSGQEAGSGQDAESGQDTESGQAGESGRGTEQASGRTGSGQGAGSGGGTGRDE